MFIKKKHCEKVIMGQRPCWLGRTDGAFGAGTHALCRVNANTRRHRPSHLLVSAWTQISYYSDHTFLWIYGKPDWLGKNNSSSREGS